jgi:hypothetical protein
MPDGKLNPLGGSDRKRTSIELPAHGTARSPEVKFGSILAANAANYTDFAGFANY